MNNPYARVASLLARYMSPLNVESVLNRVLEDANLHRDTLSLDDLKLLEPQFEPAIRLFVLPSNQALLRRNLKELAGGNLTLSKMRVPIKTELDISTARMQARDLCVEIGSRGPTVQKVATIVSELARNIVNYTATGGHVELDLLGVAPRRLRIVAEDSGGGIANIQEILAGNYKSKTGLGKGLLGVKRLSQDFKLETGSTGTRIEVMVTV